MGSFSYIVLKYGYLFVMSAVLTIILSELVVFAVGSVFSYLREKKSTQIVCSLLPMSRLPLKEPKVSHKGKPMNMPIHAKGRLINSPVPPVPLVILRQICYDNINVTIE